VGDIFFTNAGKRDLQLMGAIEALLGIDFIDDNIQLK
jgi:hypothetical protein